MKRKEKILTTDEEELNEELNATAQSLAELREERHVDYLDDDHDLHCNCVLCFRDDNSNKKSFAETL